MDEITETATEICDIFLEAADPAFYPQLRMLKNICEKFTDQHPSLNNLISEWSYLELENVTPEEHQDFILQFRYDGEDCYVIVTIKIYQDEIIVYHLRTKSIWTTSGKCIVAQTTDPLATEYPDLKSYLFAIFSKMV